MDDSSTPVSDWNGLTDQLEKWIGKMNTNAKKIQDQPKQKNQASSNRPVFAATNETETVYLVEDRSGFQRTDDKYSAHKPAVLLGNKSY